MISKTRGHGRGATHMCWPLSRRAQLSRASCNGVHLLVLPLLPRGGRRDQSSNGNPCIVMWVFVHRNAGVSACKEGGEWTQALDVLSTMARSSIHMSTTTPSWHGYLAERVISCFVVCMYAHTRRDVHKLARLLTLAEDVPMHVRVRVLHIMLFHFMYRLHIVVVICHRCPYLSCCCDIQYKTVIFIVCLHHGKFNFRTVIRFWDFSIFFFRAPRGSKFPCIVLFIFGCDFVRFGSIERLEKSAQFEFW